MRNQFPLFGEKQAIFEDVLQAKAAGDLSAYFSGIRAIYRLHQPEIDAGRYDPLFVPWTLLFTPIEYETWIDLGSHNIAMFPQFPALHYFLDFADPWNKIALECDGKNWHDAKRDKRRDAELESEGWWIRRISGRTIWGQKDDERHWLDDFVEFSRLRRRR